MDAEILLIVLKKKNDANGTQIFIPQVMHMIINHFVSKKLCQEVMFIIVHTDGDKIWAYDIKKKMDDANGTATLMLSGEAP